MTHGKVFLWILCKLEFAFLPFYALLEHWSVYVFSEYKNCLHKLCTIRNKINYLILFCTIFESSLAIGNRSSCALPLNFGTWTEGPCVSSKSYQRRCWKVKTLRWLKIRKKWIRSSDIDEFSSTVFLMPRYFTKNWIWTHLILINEFSSKTENWNF